MENLETFRRVYPALSFGILGNFSPCCDDVDIQKLILSSQDPRQMVFNQSFGILQMPFAIRDIAINAGLDDSILRVSDVCFLQGACCRLTLRSPYHCRLLLGRQSELQFPFLLSS